ncbi:hypothetical protein FIBSPDRAFT_968017 [Athelia psychrophila]|uniref:Uncharacterized protein n=1 Tax=Athelia psychrophila TaxID=1759441 RepID=A0A167V2Q4_9AGAM|nr:hypothetical protein FIBSPDRAFT_968017 [Fibularhizoctonia sp. CBS 109695]
MQRAEGERKTVKVKDMEVWEVLGGVARERGVAFVEAAGGSASTRYTMQDVHKRVHRGARTREPKRPVVHQPRCAAALHDSGEEQMQPWHDIAIDGEEPIVKKGALKPISVVAKIRQGKVSTLISGFEPFLVVFDVWSCCLR